jgi:hypothetical protein
MRPRLVAITAVVFCALNASAYAQCGLYPNRCYGQRTPAPNMNRSLASPRSYPAAPYYGAQPFYKPQPIYRPQPNSRPPTLQSTYYAQPQNSLAAAPVGGAHPASQTRAGIPMKPSNAFSQNSAPASPLRPLDVPMKPSNAFSQNSAAPSSGSSGNPSYYAGQPSYTPTTVQTSAAPSSVGANANYAPPPSPSASTAAGTRYSYRCVVAGTRDFCSVATTAAATYATPCRCGGLSGQIE